MFTGITPLQYAVYRGKVATIPDILERYPNDLNATDQYGNTALHMAAYRGARRTIDLLREAGADMQARDAQGNTALHAVAGTGAADAAQALVDYGLSAGDRNSDGKTPLQLCMEFCAPAKKGAMLALLRTALDAEASSPRGETGDHAQRPTELPPGQPVEATAPEVPPPLAQLAAAAETAAEAGVTSEQLHREISAVDTRLQHELAAAAVKSLPPSPQQPAAARQAAACAAAAAAAAAAPPGPEAATATAAQATAAEAPTRRRESLHRLPHSAPPALDVAAATTQDADAQRHAALTPAAAMSVRFATEPFTPPLLPPITAAEEQAQSPPAAATPAAEAAAAAAAAAAPSAAAGGAACGTAQVPVAAVLAAVQRCAALLELQGEDLAALSAQVSRLEITVNRVARAQKRADMSAHAPSG